MRINKSCLIKRDYEAPFGDRRAKEINCKINTDIFRLRFISFIINKDMIQGCNLIIVFELVAQQP